MLVTRETTVEEILDRFPKANKWLSQRLIHCTQCGEPVWGTISQLLESKNFDVDKTLVELNTFLEDTRG